VPSVADSVRTEIYFARQTPEAHKETVRAAFAEAGLTIDREGPLAMKADLGPTLAFGVTFIVTAAAAGVIGGASWEFAKAGIRRGLAVLRTIWNGGTIEIERAPNEYVWYRVPDGMEGDVALEAIEEDFTTAPSGGRNWVPGAGWVSDRDLIAAMDKLRDDPPLD
jgi:hypothetical protein